MSVDDKERFKRKALRAARAVTLSAAFVGVAACAEDTKREPGWDVGNDVQADVADSGSDGDTITEDSGPVCSTAGADGTCPEECNFGNDIDCCLKMPGGDWINERQECSFYVEGPLVPPDMRV